MDGAAAVGILLVELSAESWEEGSGAAHIGP